jgi:hypothetical protein
VNKHNSHAGIILADPDKRQYTAYLRKIMRHHQMSDELTMEMLRLGGYFDSMPQ